MNKKMVLMTALLVNVVVAVFGTDFEERISEKNWFREYYNEVIYRQDRNIILLYQTARTETEFFNHVGDYMIFWFEMPQKTSDKFACGTSEDKEYPYRIRILDWYKCKIREISSDLYELRLPDVCISQEYYENALKEGYDMRFALEATEPEYSLYCRFDGEYLYLYLEDGKTLFATYCAYDDAEEEALYDAICTNDFYMSKFTFPRHADGTCDYENAGAGGRIQKKKIVNGVYRVTENLRLRGDEGTSAGSLTTMPAGTRVKILSNGREETIDGITDNWVQVKVQWGSKDIYDNDLYGTTGWCFGGYLK